ncbi:MAG: transglycosylase domain-containing protein [Nitriliruptoraceae bacterium]
MSSVNGSSHGSGTSRGLAVVLRIVAITGIVGVISGLIGVLFLPGAIAATDVVAAVRSDVLDIAPMGEATATPENSYIFDANSQQLAELTFEENRVPVSLSEIPQVAVDAVLATEDANFYTHEGVHHLAILRAAVDNFRSGEIESGASTITQQYVKLAFLTPEQTYQRKIQEAIYALELERQLTKDQILELYLNRSYYGSGVYGIGTAAERYFSKDIGDISLGEAAALAGILRSPERNNPIASLQNATDRRDVVLRQMANHGFISQAQAEQAMNEPLRPVISDPPPPEYPFWTDLVSRVLVNEQLASDLGMDMSALEAMGATTDERRRRVFQSGLRIYTTLDPQMQAYAEEAIRQHLTYDEEPLHEIAQEPMGSIVSVEPGTGAIRAMAIGPHTYGTCSEDSSWVGETEDGQLLCDRTKVNPAVRGIGGSGRQPGSAYKPFVLAAALEDGVPPSLTLDARGPKEIDGCIDGTAGSTYVVRNSGGDDILNMYQAVARSSNVYHAMLVAEIGPEKLVHMSHRLGITSELGANCSLALGAADVSPLEMATAYATLANRGEYCAPFPITRIEDADGNLIWDYTPNCRQVLDTEIADRVVDMLAGPVSGGGTAPIANLGRWPTRGKTGTTNDFVDAWFVGFVRQLATAAWIGYPNGQRFYVDEDAAQEACGDQHFLNQCPPTRSLMQNVTVAGQGYARIFGGTIPAPMWRTYMGSVVEQFEPQGFTSPPPMPTGPIPNLARLARDLDLDELEQLAIEAGFRVQINEVEDYRPAGEIIRQTPAAGEVQPLGTLIVIEVSDGSGAEPIVPDVVGMTYEEARERIRRAGFEAGRNNPATNDPDEDGIVLRQRPDPGAGPDDRAFDDDPRVIVWVGRYESS